MSPRAFLASAVLFLGPVLACGADETNVQTDGGPLTIQCTSKDCFCPDGATCTMTCPNGDTCYAQCGKGATCSIDCAGSTDCAARCQENAICRVRRQTGASPTVTCASGADCKTCLGECK